MLIFVELAVFHEDLRAELIAECAVLGTYGEEATSTPPAHKQSDVNKCTLEIKEDMNLM